MSSLFADIHNVVAILKKSDVAKGFEQIIDFLSGSYIHYALTVSPHIYISCIKQFWNSISVKRSGDVTRVGKGFSGVETPLFEGMLAVGQPAEEGLGAEQVQVDADVAAAVIEDVVDDVNENVAHIATPSPPPHDIPSLSQEPSSPPQQQQSSPQAPPQDAKFPTQLQQVLNVCSAPSKRVKNLKTDNAAQKLEIVQLKARVKTLEKANKIKSSKLRRLRKVGTSRRVESSDDIEDVFNHGRMIADMDTNEEIELVKDAEIAESEGRQADKQVKIYNIDLDHSLKVLSVQEDDSEVEEVVEVVTTAKLITEVVTAAASQVSVVSTTIPAVSATILAVAPTRRRKGVIIRDPEEELSLKTSAETPAETPKVKDKGKGIMIEAPKPMKKKDQIELDAEYARKLHEELNKDDGSPMLIFVQSFKLAKRRKLNEEAQKAEALKKQLEIVHDEDDDVFTEATPIGRKVPVVNYEIVMINNKPRYKIIRADDTHQLYISFITLLKNFDREDLEDLWKIVKDRFSTSKPTNFSDDYLLSTLKTMFEKTDGQDAIWRNQQNVYGQALVKMKVKTARSNIDAARLKLKLFKDITAAADDVKR
uniref:Xylulose kinase-1 n=1 Tax=Tanacetum cinerariifolium TaxID=118510 RepID=A0A6L2J9E2_TANCI|nr:hypothetical protein [Tanacetum cinerariifolium]